MPEAENEKISRVYEVGYHLVPTLKEEDIDKSIGATRALIEKAGGSFIAEGAPSLMKLAYSISKLEAGKRIHYDRGYFGWIKFESTVEAIKEISEGLATDSHVLRSMVFKTVREDTRAKLKMPLREVKRTDTLKAAPRREVPAAAAPVSEEELDKAIETLTSE